MMRIRRDGGIMHYRANKMNANSSTSPNSKDAHSDDIVKSMVQKDSSDPSFSVLEENNSSVISDRIERIDKIINLKKEMISSCLDDVRSAVETEKKIVALFERVQSRISHSQGYCKAISLVIFCAIYVTALLLQIDNEATCGVEGGFIQNIIYNLPGGIQGGFLSSTNDFWNFLIVSIVNATFKDSICGDGTCNLPSEYPGFGRFGCIQDCGRYSQTTTITINLRDFVMNEQTYNADKEPCDNRDPKPPCRYLGAVNQSSVTNPRFKYNIYSFTMGDYLWSDDVDVNQVRRVEVPDGDFELRLYQTQKTSEAVDLADMYQTLFAVPSTVPSRAAERDFDFGDPREYLATSSALIADVNEYCWGPNQASHNYACNWHPPLDTLITALASYGVTGTVVMSAGMRRTTTLAEVSFCGALPNGSLGLTAPENRAALLRLGVPCPSRSLRKQARLTVASVGGGRPRESEKNDGDEISAKASLRASSLSLPVGSICTSHSDCSQDTRDPFYNHTGTFCERRDSAAAGVGTCSYCAFCQNDWDGVDGRCLSQCEVGEGFPQCIDVKSLATDFTCPSSFPFTIYRFSPSGQPPAVVPPSQPILPEVTTHNLLIGPIIITQMRRRPGPCLDVQSWPLRAFANRTACPSSRDGRPYGMDPTFLSSSAIYDGKQSIEPTYNGSEVRTIRSDFGGGASFTKRVPYGFFPHQYDGNTGRVKNSSEISLEDVDSFKLYFDGILTLTQANLMVTYMQEGGFIDNETTSITLDMITFNADLNLFSVLTINFDWQRGGSISWDFKQHSKRFDLYSGSTAISQKAMEVLSIVLLSIFMAVDFWILLVHIRRVKLQSIFSFGNVFDWAHWSLMAYAWKLWYDSVVTASNFKMMLQSDYWVLMDPTASSRPFLTNSTNEMNYLKFHQQVFDYVLKDSEFYNAIISCCVILFVIRVLRSFEFQIHLGVITRTFGAAWDNLLHFLALLLAVFFGYSVAGHLFFGHEVQTLSTLERSMIAHLWITLTLDPTTFYDQFRHAAPAWIFQMYVWSFLLFCGFLLFNIFLAILVDAYVEVRSKALSSKTLLEDVTDVSVHAVKSLFLPSKVFVSDWNLRSRLSRILNKNQQEHAILPRRKQVLELLMNSIHRDSRALYLPGGVEINPATLMKLGMPPQNDPLQSCITPFSLDTNEDGQDDERVDPWVDRVIERYTDPINAQELEESIVSDIRAESFKRDIFTFRAHQRIHEAVSRVDSLVELVASKMLSPGELLAARTVAVKKVNRDECNELLQVTIQEAEHLPKKDILRSVDPFCLVCMVSDPRDPTGKHTYKTRVISGDRNPKWNEQFMFPLPANPNDATMITVVVLDYDKCSVDDVIGFVTVDVYREVPPAPDVLETWFPIMGDSTVAKVKGARIRIRLERLGKVYRAPQRVPSGGGGACEGAAAPSGGTEARALNDDAAQPVPSATQASVVMEAGSPAGGPAAEDSP